MRGPRAWGWPSGGVRGGHRRGPLGCPRVAGRVSGAVGVRPSIQVLHADPIPVDLDRQARPASPAPRHERAASIARGGRSRPSAPNDAAPTVRHRSARSSARSRIAFRRPASASTSAARSDSSAETARCRSASRPIRVTSVRSAWFCFRRCAIRRASSRCIHVRICARAKRRPRIRRSEHDQPPPSRLALRAPEVADVHPVCADRHRGSGEACGRHVGIPTGLRDRYGSEEHRGAHVTAVRREIRVPGTGFHGSLLAIGKVPTHGDQGAGAGVPELHVPMRTC